MTHLDLFSGIGGFAYAADQVWDNMEHIFVEFDPFCQQVLKKHWKEAPIYGDIRQFNPNTYSKRLEGQKERPSQGSGSRHQRPFILTGGFPCQPFSTAGLRRGTADDRHLWPEMLRVIQFTKPTWIIAENVRGLVTWNDGMVLEQICTDLETEGYEVQPLIIPAVAVNAPHRRDRIWLIAYAEGGNDRRNAGKLSQADEFQAKKRPQERPTEFGGADKSDAANAGRLRREPRWSETLRSKGQKPVQPNGKQFNEGHSWESDWHEVAAELCRLDDGLPVELGEFKLTKAAHRKEQLKAYGETP